MRWKCLVIDDDPVLCELVTSYCKMVGTIEKVDVANAGTTALQMIGANRYDLIFLDLNLPEVSGKDLLTLMPPDLPVVVVTADPGFAVESYLYNVVGYLVKPFTLAEFLKTMTRLKSVLAEPDHLFVKDGTEQTRITLSEVRYIKSESNYVTFYLGGKRIMSLLRLSDLETELPRSFIRVHRSWIVNTRFVKHAASSHLMVEETRIPVSESYRPAVAQSLQLPL